MKVERYEIKSDKLYFPYRISNFNDSLPVKELTGFLCNLIKDHDLVSGEAFLSFFEMLTLC